MSGTPDFDAFASAFCRYFELDGVEVSQTTRLTEDLGFDSISRYELLLLLEDLAGFELPGEITNDLIDLSDVFHYYDTYTANQRN